MTFIAGEFLDAPVTTLAKLRRVGLDPAHFATCAPPNTRMGVRGCSQYHRCRLKFKNHGPQIVGVQLIYSDGGRKDSKRNCYNYVAAHERHTSGGHVFRVVAYQGEAFVYRIIEPQNITKNANGDVTSKTNYQTVTKTEIIPMWPEPEDNPGLTAALYNIKTFSEFRDEQELAQQAEAMSNVSGQPPASYLPTHDPAENRHATTTDGGGDSGGANPGPGPRRSGQRQPVQGHPPGPTDAG